MNAPLRGLIRGLAISLVLAVAVGTWIYFNRPSGERELIVHSTGKALIGGTFTLTSHLGESVSDSDFRGKLMLVYFGYTFCPDVCPLDMRRLSMGAAMPVSRPGRPGVCRTSSSRNAARPCSI